MARSELSVLVAVVIKYTGASALSVLHVFTQVKHFKRQTSGPVKMRTQMQHLAGQDGTGLRDIRADWSTFLPHVWDNCFCVKDFDVTASGYSFLQISWTYTRTWGQEHTSVEWLHLPREHKWLHSRTARINIAKNAWQQLHGSALIWCSSLRLHYRYRCWCWVSMRVSPIPWDPSRLFEMNQLVDALPWVWKPNATETKPTYFNLSWS